MKPALQVPLFIASFLLDSATHQQGFRPDHHINIQSTWPPAIQTTKINNWGNKSRELPWLVSHEFSSHALSDMFEEASQEYISAGSHYSRKLAFSVSLWVQVLNSVKKQARVTEDGDNSNASNGAEPQPSTTCSVAQNAMESAATGMLSPPPSRPGTPELPPAPPPSPTVGARDAFLSRPCVPNYSLHHADSTNGEKRNG